MTGTEKGPVQIRADIPEEAWDNYVYSHRHGGFAHLSGWGDVIQKVYGHPPLFLGAVRKNGPGSYRVCGILPLCIFGRPFSFSRLISMPYLDRAGVLADGPETEAALVRAAAARGAALGAKGLYLRQDRAVGCPDYPARPRVFRGKANLALELGGTSGEVLARFKSKLRSQILKGGKNRLTWKIGRGELIHDFYRVFSRNMRDLGSPVHSMGWFRAIFSRFSHKAFICMVYHRGRPAAGGFMFRFGKRVSNPWASSVRQWRHLNTNVFLYWQMIRFACQAGAGVFDMGRSSKGAPTYRFKDQWGPVSSPLFWYSWDLSAPDGSGRCKEGLSIRSWKKLPLGIANLAGPLMRRYISL